MQLEGHLRNWLTRFRPTIPPVAALLEPPHLYGLRVAEARKDLTTLVRHEEALSSGSEAFLPEGEALERSAESLMTHLGAPKRLSVVVGDPFFKIQVLAVEDFPREEKERAQVILWQLRKLLNAPLDQVRLRYEVLSRSGGTVSLLVAVCREADAAALEEAFARRGCHVGFLGPSSLALLSLAEARGALPSDGSALLVNRTETYLSLLFVDRGIPAFFRCKDLAAFEREEAEETERLAQEMRLTLAYFRDRVGGSKLSSVWVRRHPPGLALPFEEELEEGVRVNDFASLLPAAPAGAPVEAALPLYGVLEGCP
ncbi:MAG: hypothetical protein ACOYXN_12795 [Acidobacteriota bacterium]